MLQVNRKGEKGCSIRILKNRRERRLDGDEQDQESLLTHARDGASIIGNGRKEKCKANGQNHMLWERARGGSAKKMGRLKACREQRGGLNPG